LLGTKLICSLKRKKFIFDAHEIFTEVPELEGRDSVKNVWKKIGLWAIPSAALRLTVNDSLKRILSEKYACDFHVIMNRPSYSVSDDGLNKFDQKKGRVILYQGAVNKGRGIWETLEAIKDIEDIKFLIAGEGDEFEAIKQALKENDTLKSKVKMLGKLTPEDLKILTKRATIGINVLSSKSLNYKYSLANKFFDYAQASVPSINMAFPEYVEHLKEFKVGLCIEELSADYIKEALLRLLEDESLYNELREACEKAKTVWVWESEAAKLQELFKSFLKS